MKIFKLSNLLVLLLVASAFFSGYFLFRSDSQKVEPKDVEDSLKIKKPDPKEHWNGKNDARYVLVEYSDLQCPFCKSIHSNLEKLQETNKSKLAWVYRHFPLPNHPTAQPAAEATECMVEQKGNDAFWKMTKQIFEKMPDFTTEDLNSLAVTLGADETKFAQCLENKKFAKKVKEQMEEGVKAGVDSTPTNFLYDLKTGNQTKIIGAVPYEDLQKSLDTFISQNK